MFKYSFKEKNLLRTASDLRVFYNKILLKISQNSQKKNYAGVSFNIKLNETKWLGYSWRQKLVHKIWIAWV